jgi:dihydrofolate reductase
MTTPYFIEGFAIVSRDGMLANVDGVMPPELMIAGDQEFFEAGLEATDAVIHGRNSQEDFRRSADRRRLIATRRVSGLAPDPRNAKAMLWNPDAVPFTDGLKRLGLSKGRIGIIGGTSIFGLFLPLYDLFHLSRADDVTLPGGRPVFPEVPAQTPEQILTAHGLRPGETRPLDPVRNARLVTWSVDK